MTARARACGMALGVVVDAIVGDPRRWHPVAGFGRAAGALEAAAYADSRARGAAFTCLSVGAPVMAAWGAQRGLRRWPLVDALATAGVTWAVLGGTSLAREGAVMAGHLESGDVVAARARLSHLCARDPSQLGVAELARATVESLAENTSDAVVAPLWWGVVAGIPGLVGYRAANTLDAMVGYRSPRYERFGWASARFDDLVNLAPARVTALITAACAPLVGGSRREAWHVARVDGRRHPSPNAGHCEAAAAGALGVRLGGVNRYGDVQESRPVLGRGRPPAVDDVRRAVLLGRAVGVAAGALAVGALAVASVWARRADPA